MPAHIKVFPNYLYEDVASITYDRESETFQILQDRNTEEYLILPERIGSAIVLLEVDRPFLAPGQDIEESLSEAYEMVEGSRPPTPLFERLIGSLFRGQNVPIKINGPLNYLRDEISRINLYPDTNLEHLTTYFAERVSSSPNSWGSLTTIVRTDDESILVGTADFPRITDAKLVIIKDSSEKVLERQYIPVSYLPSYRTVDLGENTALFLALFSHDYIDQYFSDGIKGVKALPEMEGYIASHLADDKNRYLVSTLFEYIPQDYIGTSTFITMSRT